MGRKLYEGGTEEPEARREDVNLRTSCRQACPPTT